ncbi:MAG: 4-hydroxy-tetrahydrodipicolinate synthase [Saprospiraceae bacterium]
MLIPTNNLRHPLSGTGVALITPFRNGVVDFPALKNIIEFVTDSGVDYLVSLGSTGESVTLSMDECRAVIDFTLEVNDGRLPVVVGMFGHNNTKQLVERFQNFDFKGIDAVLSSSPSYNKPTQEGIFQHYVAVAEVSPVPIIIYNVPSRTGSNVAPETVVRLAKADTKFIGVKEATGDIVQTSHIIKNKPEHFLVLSGDDPTALASVACGGDGLISVIANCLPYETSQMVHQALNNNITSAQQYHLQLLNMHHWLYLEGNPVGLKAAMEIQGLCTREVRLPLVPFSEKYMESLKAEMELVKEMAVE